MLRIGIDLGGTKISGIVLDAQGKVLAYERLPTPSGDYRGTLKAIADLVITLESATSPIDTVGIGTPGALSPTTGYMRNFNSTCLNGMPLRQDLQQILGRTVQIANDADCFALSEASDGAGRGAASVFGVILGTGVGGGLVINGHLLQGPNAITGEWGHNPLPWMRPDEYPGNTCYCGQKGCIETFLSGPAMQTHHQHYENMQASSHEIVAMADNDPAAGRTLDRYIDQLARALAGVINLVDPEVIVLGGGMSNIDQLYERVPMHWGKYVFSDAVGTRLVKHLHGDDSGVRGAAWLEPD